MGKKHKHSQDKLHQTVSELRSHHVGADRDLELSTLHRRLKFDSCCLTLNTVSVKPMGLNDDEGYCYVFECDMIIKFLEKFNVHPITGKKVSIKDLFELKFHKNTEGNYHCPVVLKLFNQHSKIVANRITGNVYSYEAYQQLNLKSNNFKDLLTEEPFERGDILTVQDPEKAATKWDVSKFYYVKNKLKVDEDDDKGNVRNIEQSAILKSSLDEFKSKEGSFMENHNKLVGQLGTNPVEGVRDKFSSANYSDGSLARSVTSTVMPMTSQQRPALLTDEQIIYPRIKKKGYLQLVTNMGPINLELYCDRTPKTCHNFLLLASRGYYDNTCFHRLIKNFVIQGGDPTGTGSGGQSAWGEPFRDECYSDLKHDVRGVLAMANSGPGTNKSQFYITLGSNLDHLDGKHTVFGRVVGGMGTLNRIQTVEVENDKPKSEVKIIQVIKYVDPFEEVQSNIEEERKSLAQAKKSNESDRAPRKKFRPDVVGLFIDWKAIESESNDNEKSNSNGSSRSGNKTQNFSEDEKTNSKPQAFKDRLSLLRLKKQ